MARRASWLAGLVAGLAVVGGARAAGPGRLEQALRRELDLTGRLVEVERAAAAFERAQETLEYAAGVMGHGAREGERRLSAYRVSRSTREAQARRRGRALYKLARGGMLRIVFDDPEGDDRAGVRIARGRTIRWLVRHDLRELDVYRRAEARARLELATAAREAQALGALRMFQDVQAEALRVAEAALAPEVRRAHRARRRAQRRARGKTRAGGHAALLRALRERRRELRGRGLDLLEAGSLRRPVRGRLVGRFGPYQDPVLRVPMERSGVELSARPGTPVRAPAAGKVAYVGELPGFERVVVLDHGGGYLSLVGRLVAIEARPGDDVAAGQVLGRVAPKRSDDGLGPTAYLELRHGDRPIDPTPYLR